MSTLRQLADARGLPLNVPIGRYADGAATVLVSLFLVEEPDGAGPQVIVSAFHRDPEGAFVERILATHLLDVVGESALSDQLAVLTFDSGVPATITYFDGFAVQAAEMLD